MTYMIGADSKGIIRKCVKTGFNKDDYCEEMAGTTGGQLTDAMLKIVKEGYTPRGLARVWADKEYSEHRIGTVTGELHEYGGENAILISFSKEYGITAETYFDSTSRFECVIVPNSKRKGDKYRKTFKHRQNLTA